MCLCILAHQQLKTHPTIVAANREEHYGRAATVPAWSERIFAGRDALAGGTWQGLNPCGLHVALTNRRSDINEPARRSRGQLCIDALRLHSARAATDWLLDHLLHVRYNPCNLLVSDGIQAFVIHYDGCEAHPTALAPGLHLLSETDVNDPDHPRIQRARAALTPLPNDWPTLKTKLVSLMAEHDRDGAICLHGERGGTRSSALIALGAGSLNEAQFHFADGPPCTAPYQDLTAQLANYR